MAVRVLGRVYNIKNRFKGIKKKVDSTVGITRNIEVPIRKDNIVLFTNF